MRKIAWFAENGLDKDVQSKEMASAHVHRYIHYIKFTFKFYLHQTFQNTSFFRLLMITVLEHTSLSMMQLSGVVK